MAALLLIVYGLPFAINFSENWIMLLGVLLPSITILIVSIFKKGLIQDVNNNRVFRILEAGFLMMGCMHYLQINKNLPAILFGIVSLFILFLVWMESRILQDQYAVFEVSHIEIERPLSTKKFYWNQLNDVVLKNNLITLHVNDDTFEQIRIQENLSETEAGDFLFFCKDTIGRKA